MRYKFLRLLAKKIFKVPEGCVIPKTLRYIHNLLFPIKSYLMNNKKINYDFMTRCYMIEGVCLPSIIIDEFKKPSGNKWYRFYMNQYKDTMVEVKVIEP